MTHRFEHPGVIDGNEMIMTPMPPLNSTLTITGFYNPEEGFRFENQTVHAPDGRVIKLVIEDDGWNVNDEKYENEKDETRFFEERGIT